MSDEEQESKSNKSESKKKKRQHGSEYDRVAFSKYVSDLYKERTSPDASMNGDTKAVLSNLIRILVEIFMCKINILLLSTGKKTLTLKDARAGCDQALLGLGNANDIYRNALESGERAAQMYSSNSTSGGTSESKANLTLKVSRVKKMMRALLHGDIRQGKGKKSRLSSLAAVYVTGVIEYIIAEIIELASNKKDKRLTVRDVKLVIDGTEELSKLFKGVILAGGVSVTSLKDRKIK
jgi:histone H3/H4